MNFLFVHQNFPGQYLHLAQHLAVMPGNRVVAITQRQVANLPGIHKIRYRPQRGVTPNLHNYLRCTEVGVLNAQCVARAALELKKTGFVPDVMLGHNGWGAIWYLKDVFPESPLIGYFEFFYRSEGADVGFDPEEKPAFDFARRGEAVGCLGGLFIRRSFEARRPVRGHRGAIDELTKYRLDGGSHQGGGRAVSFGEQCGEY